LLFADIGSDIQKTPPLMRINCHVVLDQHELWVVGLGTGAWSTHTSPSEQGMCIGW
jgi:hypothetical protein